jgi:hypothetical protein
MTAWYRTGTVTATNGSGTVTGALTAWLANAKVGDAFTFDADSKVYEITAVGGDTSITIAPVYAGSTGASKAYGINRTSTAWNDSSQLALDIANFIATYDPLGLSSLSDPNADRVPFWDDSASAMAWLTLSGLGISGTTLSVDTDLMSTARWTTSTVVSATTTNVMAETSPIVTVTGSTGPITSLGNSPNRLRIVRFTGTPTITYNATTLILPGAANYVVPAGAVMLFASDASGNVRWMATPADVLLTTKGDLAGFSTQPARVAVGSNGNLLMADSAQATGVGWKQGVTTKGDLWTHSSVPARLAVGTDGQALVADSAETTGLKWVTRREVMTAGRTYYVRTDGSDSNTGLVNTSGGAFLTIGKAVDTASGTLDTAGFTVTVSVGAGTFAETVTLKPLTGGGLLTITGAGNTTIISPASSNCISGTTGGRFTLSAARLTRASGSGHGILVQNGTFLTCSGVEFGSLAAGRHVFATQGAIVLMNAAYTINGGAQMHWSASSGGYIQSVNTTVTISSTPAFSSRFADVFLCGTIQCNGNTFSGSATGTRYLADVNGAIYTAGGGASFLPGNAGGSVTNGGAYV